MACYSPAAISLLFVLSIFLPSYASESISVGPPTVTWAKTIGGAGVDITSSVQQTPDGGFIAVGLTNSFGAGDSDVWVFKMDSEGTVVWQMAYGGAGIDWAASVLQNPDGGYFVIGNSRSFGGPNDIDIWVLRLDNAGNSLWEKRYGVGEATSAVGMPDGGLVITGSSTLRLNAQGDILWQKALREGYFYSVERSSIEELVFAGFTTSFGAGETDLWLVKMDHAGNIIWQRAYGGVHDDRADHVGRTSDGGLIVTGSTRLVQGEDLRIWILRLDSSGSIVWQKAYSQTNGSPSAFAEEALDGGFAVAATVKAAESDTNLNVLRLDSSGSVVWERSYGGPRGGVASSLQTTIDGGLIVAGATDSFGGGTVDAFVLKLDQDGMVFGPCRGGARPAVSMTMDTTADVTETSSIAVDTQRFPLATNGSVSTFPSSATGQCRVFPAGGAEF